MIQGLKFIKVHSVSALSNWSLLRTRWGWELWSDPSMSPEGMSNSSGVSLVASSTLHSCRWQTSHYLPSLLHPLLFIPWLCRFLHWAPHLPLISTLFSPGKWVVVPMMLKLELISTSGSFGIVYKAYSFSLFKSGPTALERGLLPCYSASQALIPLIYKTAEPTREASVLG